MSSAQSFEFTNITDTVYCYSTILPEYCSSSITNIDTVAQEIDIIRISKPSLVNWITGICTNVICYPIGMDSIRVVIEPNSSLELKPGYKLGNFYTTEIAKSTFIIRDVDDPSSEVFFDAYAINGNDFTNSEDILLKEQISIGPNPTSGLLHITTDLKIETVELISLDGKVLKQWNDKNNIDLSQFENGLFLLKVNTASGFAIKRTMKF